MNQSVIYELNPSEIGLGREYPAACDTPVSFFNKLIFKTIVFFLNSFNYLRN